MKVQEKILLFISLSMLGVYEAASQGWLGPYGLPGDNLHLLLLVSVLTFTFLAYIFVTANIKQKATL